MQCFQDVFPLVEKFLPGEKKTAAVSASKNDRLIQLVIKGVLYESCVTYCQAKATGTAEGSAQEMTFSKLLDGSVGNLISIFFACVYRVNRSLHFRL